VSWLIFRKLAYASLSYRSFDVSFSSSPWNYPLALSLLPFVGAIAAGCTCAIKPSEHTPTVSSLLTELFPKYLDPDAFAVINGTEAETTHLLELKWDHIFFTGSNHIGRIVAAAAAKNITPVTLELGGKSPVFIDAGHTDLEIAAKRVLWGKIQNAGQVSISSSDRIFITVDIVKQGLRRPRLHTRTS
jgi:aldehyde dehydrogenase (NAD+)